MDVVRGTGPSPALVLLLVRRLPDTSMTAALMAGGREFFGWGHERSLMAGIYDAINANTRATGNWGKGKVPKIPAWPRPSEAKKVEKKPVTVADLYMRMTRR